MVISTYLICPVPHLSGLEKFNLHLKISLNSNPKGTRTLNWQQEDEGSNKHEGKTVKRSV